MASLRTRFQSAADDASGGYAPFSDPAWQNPSGALADGGEPAKVVTVDVEVTTNQLVLTNTVDKVPAGATIDGIEYHFKIQTDSDGIPGLPQIAYQTVRPVVGGVATGANRAIAQQQTVTAGPPVTQTFGGAADKFGLTPTVSDVNGTGFGVAVAVDGTNIGASEVKMHDVEVTIHYTE